METDKLDGCLDGMNVIVAGTAPSLNHIDLKSLSGIPIITCNRALQNEALNPSFLLVADRRPYMNEYERYKKSSKKVKILLSTTIFDPRVRCHNTEVQPEPPWRWYPWRVGVCSTDFNWQTFSRPLCSFATIFGPMLQAAVIMGARKIGVIGIDMEAPKSGDSLHFYGKEGSWEGYNSGKYSPGAPVVADFKVKLLLEAAKEMEGYGAELLNLSPWKETRFSRIFGTYDIGRFIDESK